MHRVRNIALSLLVGSTLNLGAAPSFPALAQVAPATPVASWNVDKAQSTIHFRSSFSGMTFEGGFSRWDARIAFDPDNLAGSSAVVTVDLASAATGDQDRDSAMPTADWFDVTKTPRAVFAASGFKDLGGGRFMATGTLSMRGVTRPVSLPFTLTISGPVAKLTGEAILDRSQFGIGQGQFEGADTVPYPVAVPIVLIAKRAG